MNKSCLDKFFVFIPECVVAHIKALIAKFLQDKEFKDYFVVSFDKYSFEMNNGWTLNIDKEWPITLNVGDCVRVYVRSNLSIVRGLYINGVKCFYRTQKQQKQFDIQMAFS